MLFLLNNKNLFTLLIVFIFAASACSSVNNDVESISEEDLSMAAEIVATSLADEEAGMMSSMYDALSTVDDNSIEYAKTSLKTKDEHHGNSSRGLERNFTHSYDSTTGIHSLSFTREFESTRISKYYSMDQEIIYTDIDGDFVAQPKVYWDTIESIDFNSTRSGYANGLFRTHEFTKIDTMLATGLHSSNSEINFNGTHRSFGNAEGTLPDSTTASRDFDIFIQYENVTINKDTIEAGGNIENAVSGTLTYNIVMNKTINGEPDNTVLEGTVDLEADGTAILRFKKFTEVFRIALNNGELRERPDNRRGR